MTTETDRAINEVKTRRVGVLQVKIKGGRDFKEKKGIDLLNQILLTDQVR